MDNKPLVLDLVEWLAEKRRTYEAVMEAGRTSGPRQTISEDAVDAGYECDRSGRNSGVSIEVTDRGRAFLNAEGRVGGRLEQAAE